MWPALVAQKQYIQGRRLYAISKSKVRYSNSVYFLECWRCFKKRSVSQKMPVRALTAFYVDVQLGQSCGSLYERRKRPSDRVAQNKGTKEYRRTWTYRSCLWDCMGIRKSGSQLESCFFVIR